jgi:hypothetical protein
LLDWTSVQSENYFPLSFPENHTENDLTYFGFADAVRLSPGSLIVIAGQSNAGKSCFARNLVWENLDRDYSIQLMVSETTTTAFARYAQRMTWRKPLKENGTPKFELVERFRDFKDIVMNGSLTIVDWLDMPDGDYYRIGTRMQEIKEQNPDGITVILIQKDGSKEDGRGGMFSRELASLYLTMDYRKLPNEEDYINWITVKKAKEWVGEHDPNNRAYAFAIANYGTQFTNIREIKKCSKCYGHGVVGKNECLNCSGTGIVEVYRVTRQPIQSPLAENPDVPF